LQFQNVCAPNTDWNEAIEVIRATHAVSVTLNNENVLELQSPPLALNVGEEVANVDGDNNITVDNQADLAELMQDAATANLHVLASSTAVNVDLDTSRRLSLVEFHDGIGIPDYAGTFDSAGDVSVLNGLSDTNGRQFYLVSEGWTGDIERTHQFKVAFAGGGPEIFDSTVLETGYSNPELSWEYYNGSGWKRLDKEKSFLDKTLNFSRSGEIEFKVPNDLDLNNIGGQEDYWIRARLIGGDYGRPRYIVDVTETLAGTTQEVTVSTEHMHPPEVASVTAKFSLPAEHLPQFVIARNNLRDLDQSSANTIVGATYGLFEGAFVEALTGVKKEVDGSFSESFSRSILIGFTQVLEPGSCSLYVAARDRDGEIKLALSTLGSDNRWTPAPLIDEDPTRGLYRTGLLSFSVTSRPARVQLLGKALYWLRINAVGEAAVSWAPSIEGMWLNGVPIVQAETVLHEPLGSANGEPNFEVNLLKTPVLPHSLELRVRERLGDEEVTALIAQLGSDAVLEGVPNLPGQWVRWSRVESLTDYNGDDRVYLLGSDGKIKFGDGQNGKLLLAGRENIRAFNYQSGGQQVETAAFAPVSLTGSIEASELVLSPSPIAGGRDTPTSSELVERMPEVMRHAGVGLSLSDIEALAIDIDSDIVQVRASTPKDKQDSIRVAVLARGDERSPVYSLARRDALHRALLMNMSDAWCPACLEIVSVKFVAVEVTVELVAVAGKLPALESHAKAVLDHFLNSSEGGPDNRGWAPGRALWPTDIRRVLIDLPELDRIDKVLISMPGGRQIGDIADDEVIATPETSAIKVLVVEEAT